MSPQHQQVKEKLEACAALLEEVGHLTESAIHAEPQVAIREALERRLALVATLHLNVERLREELPVLMKGKG